MKDMKVDNKKFNIQNLRESLRHLRCMPFSKFEAIPWGCDSKHLWDKLIDNGPANFIMELDDYNLEVLSNYLDKYFKEL